MTLSTLKTMNVTVGDLGNAMKLRTPDAAPAPHPAPKGARATTAAPASSATPAGVVDPMQWWGALTQQFTQLAVQAMKDGGADAAKSFAGTVAKQSIDAAGRALNKAATVPGAAAQRATPTPRRKRTAR